MHILTYITAFLLILLGGDWLLQWLNVVPGSMSGESQSGLYGAVMVTGGLFLLLWTGRQSTG